MGVHHHHHHLSNSSIGGHSSIAIDDVDESRRQSTLSSEPPFPENDDDDDPFDWESCYNMPCTIEHLSNSKKEWFYFASEDDRRHYKQPTITVMDPSSKVHIDISPTSIIPK